PGLESRKKYTAFFPEKEKRAVDMALEAWRGRHHARSVADALHAGLENAPGLERLYPEPGAERNRFLTTLGNLLAFYADSTVWTEEGDFLVRECADYPFFNSL